MRSNFTGYAIKTQFMLLLQFTTNKMGEIGRNKLGICQVEVKTERNFVSHPSEDKFLFLCPIRRIVILGYVACNCYMYIFFNWPFWWYRLPGNGKLTASLLLFVPLPLHRSLPGLWRCYMGRRTDFLLHFCLIRNRVQMRTGCLHPRWTEPPLELSLYHRLLVG